MASVAELQRGYKKLLNTIKNTGTPLVIVNNGKPEAVLVDIGTYQDQVSKLEELENSYLLRVAKKGLGEYKKGKTTKLSKDQKLIDIL